VHGSAVFQAKAAGTDDAANDRRGVCRHKLARLATLP
jgi:hypothetical protein